MVKPEIKILVIENSLRCFRYGAAGLIPLFGIPFVIMAIRCRYRVWLNSYKFWNPAIFHVKAGFILAWLGGLINVAVLGSMLLALCKLVVWSYE